VVRHEGECEQYSWLIGSAIPREMLSICPAAQILRRPYPTRPMTIWSQLLSLKDAGLLESMQKTPPY